jgi:hypothetical protein
MFLPGRTVLTAGSADFPTARDGMRSPLARKLFGIDGACCASNAAHACANPDADASRCAALRRQASLLFSSAPTS